MDRLIDLTVDQARRQSSFYARRFAAVADSALFDYERLAELPALEREEVEEAGTTIRARYAEYGLTSYTSGTSRGHPLSIDRSRQEERYLADLVGRLQDGVAERSRVVLLLATWHHGMQLRLPGKAIGLPVHLSNEIGFQQARALLTRTFPIDGEEVAVSAIAGSVNRLQQLTAYLRDDGDELSPRVDFLQTTGRYMTEYTARELRAAWNAKLVDRFSLTELFLGATRCETCGWFHFDCFGVPEVVDRRTGERLESGRGRLLLTGLYPFTQMTPLIRYAPGDVAEVRRGDCPRGERGYRILGRTASAVDLDGIAGVGSFLSGAEIYEVLDPLADVNRLPDPPTSMLSRAPLGRHVAEAGGLPVFRAVRDGERAAVDVELRYAPKDFPERAASVTADLEAALAQRCHWLAPAITRRAVSVRVRSPGWLASSVETRP